MINHKKAIHLPHQAYQMVHLLVPGVQSLIAPQFASHRKCHYHYHSMLPPLLSSLN